MSALFRVGRFAAALSMVFVMLFGVRSAALAQDGADNGDYTGPTFGVTLSYDVELWTVKNDVSAKENDGRDELRLINGDTDGVLYLETYDGYNGKAGDCIDGAVNEVTGDARLTALEDRRGNAIEGSEKGITWAAYSFTDSDGTTLATYVECRALPKGAGVFVASLITLPENFDSDYRDAQDILDTVDVGTTSSSKSSGNSKTGGNKTGSSDKTPTPTAGTSSQGDATQVGDFLTVEVPADWTVRPFGPDSFSEGGAQIYNLTVLTSVTLFTVSPEVAAMGVEEMLNTYADISSKSLGQDLAPAQFSDGSAATEVKAKSGYAYYLFKDAGIQSILYVNILVLDDGRAIVFAATAPQQLFDQVYKDSLQPMMDSIRYLG